MRTQFANWIAGTLLLGRCSDRIAQVLIQVEADTGDKLHTPTGVWIEKFISSQALAVAEEVPTV